MDPPLRQALQCTQFYDGQQLTDDEIRVLRDRKQPIVIMNRVRPAVNGIVGVVERGRIDPKAIPREPTDEDSANLATDVLRYVADYNRFQVLRSRMFLDMLRAGWTGSIQEVDEEGEVVSVPIRWEELIWDSASRELDCRDARFLGIAKWYYVDDLQAEYPQFAKEIGNSFAIGRTTVQTMEDRPFGGYGWVDTNSRRVLVIEMYHRENGEWYRCKFIRSLALEAGPSAFKDKRGRGRCPIEVVRCYVDTQNRPYGVIVDMMDPQREVNARRSWLLRNLVARQVIAQKGMVEDKDAALQTLASSSGWLEVNDIAQVQLQDKEADIAGHTALMQEAKGEIDRQAPNPALQGREDRVQSGRALLARQQAGLLELSSVLSAFEDYTLRIYRQWWQCCRQFWTAPRYIKITSDVKAPEYLMVNQPVGVEVVQDPQTGLPTIQPKLAKRLAELDVDITIDSSPDVASIEEEQFQALAELFPQVAAVNPMKADALLDELIASSPIIRNKQQLLEKMQGPQQPNPMQQMAMQLEMQGKQAEVEKTQSETAKNVATTQKTQVETAAIVHGAAREDAGMDQASQDRAQRDREGQRNAVLKLRDQDSRERQATMKADRDRDGM